MSDRTRVLLSEASVDSFDAYASQEGGRALEKALAMAPEAIIAEIKKSCLRGRGGAGFPTGVKWASVAHDPCPTKYLVCNGAEGEPGTFKDRFLLRSNPYQLLEGMAIAARAIGVRTAYLCLKKSFEKEVAAVRRAMDEMTAAKALGSIPIELVLGPEDYLFGEEKALLEVIEGGPAMPREADLPPYVQGLFVTGPTELNPAVVNNVETLSNVPHILRRGATWFRSIGTPDTPGTMVFTVSGDVQTPGVYELPMGTPLQELVFERGGGPKAGRKLKALFSGVSNPVVLPSSLATPLDFGSMQKIGSGLGSGGFIAYDDTACMVRVAHKLSEFLFVESCGQCTPCKFGTNQSTYYLHKLVHGSGDRADLDHALEGSAMAPHANRCYLPVEHSSLIPSIVRNFGDEFEQHFNRGCRSCRDIGVPKMVDFDPSKALFVYFRGRRAGSGS
jgi:NADH:ubiquinone oxidoreductase subunit F (NADH-binding)